MSNVRENEMKHTAFLLPFRKYQMYASQYLVASHNEQKWVFSCLLDGYKKELVNKQLSNFTKLTTLY